MSKTLCCVDRCLTKSTTIKVKNVIYYLFPAEEEWASKWEKKIKAYDPNFIRTPNSLICSLHFGKTSMLPVTRQLVDYAEPCFFPQSRPSRDFSSKPVTIIKRINQITPNSSCCIQGCPTKFDEKNKGFEFPKCENRRTLWVHLIIRHDPVFEYKNNMRVCRLHFKKESIHGDELSLIADPKNFPLKGEKVPRLLTNQSQKSESAAQKRLMLTPESLRQLMQQKTVNTIFPVQRKCPPITVRRLPERFQPPGQWAPLSKLLPKPQIVFPTKLKETAIHRRESIDTSVNSPGTLLVPMPTTSLPKTTVTAKGPNLRPVSGSALNVLKLINERANTAVEPQHGMSGIFLKSQIPTSTVVSSNLSNNQTNNRNWPIIRKVYSLNRARMPPSLTNTTTVVKSIQEQQKKIVNASLANHNVLQKAIAAHTSTTNSNHQSIKQTIPNDISMNSDIIVLGEKDEEIVQSLNIGEIEKQNIVGNSNKEAKQGYYMITKDKLNGPRLLLDRIKRNKRLNEELEEELAILEELYPEILTADDHEIPNDQSIETIDIN